MRRAIVHRDEAVAEGLRGEDGDRDEGAVATTWSVMFSEAESSEASSPWLLTMRSKTSRGWWFIPSSYTSPVYSAFIRSISL